MPKSYRDLQIWNRSYDLTKNVYILCDKLPKSEQFGLISQLQRCAVSIPSNIAEGQQRGTAKEFRHFLHIARGSAAELSTQLLLVEDIYQVNTEKLVAELEELQKMIYALTTKL